MSPINEYFYDALQHCSIFSNDVQFLFNMLNSVHLLVFTYTGVVEVIHFLFTAQSLPGVCRFVMYCHGSVVSFLLRLLVCSS